VKLQLPASLVRISYSTCHWTSLQLLITDVLTAATDPQVAGSSQLSRFARL
jgi:hypothetical protein